MQQLEMLRAPAMLRGVCCMQGWDACTGQPENAERCNSPTQPSKPMSSRSQLSQSIRLSRSCGLWWSRSAQREGCKERLLPAAVKPWSRRCGSPTAAGCGGPGLHNGRVARKGCCQLRWNHKPVYEASVAGASCGGPGLHKTCAQDFARAHAQWSRATLTAGALALQLPHDRNGPPATRPPTLLRLLCPPGAAS